MKCVRGVFALILNLFLVAACAPTSSFQNELVTSSNEGIIDGTRVNSRSTAAAKSVVYIEMLNASNQESGFCTGALIGPNTVLTAAHCFDSDLLPNIKSFNIVFENRVDGSRPRVDRHGAAFLVHPSYNTERRRKPYAYDHDIAVASFFGEIPKGFTTVKLDSDAQANYAGLNVYVYGFGRFSDYVGNSTDLGRSGGTGYLRKGVMKVGPEFLQHADRYYTSTESDTFVCQGDSGGPQFYHENGVLKVIGVNSAALGVLLDSGRRSCKGISQVTKVAPAYGWLMGAQKKLSGRN